MGLFDTSSNFTEAKKELHGEASMAVSLPLVDRSSEHPMSHQFVDKFDQLANASDTYVRCLLGSCICRCTLPLPLRNRREYCTYPALVEEADGGDDLLEDGPGLPLREELLPHDLVQQLAAPHELEHQAHLIEGSNFNY